MPLLPERRAWAIHLDPRGISEFCDNGDYLARGGQYSAPGPRSAAQDLQEIERSPGASRKLPQHPRVAGLGLRHLISPLGYSGIFENGAYVAPGCRNMRCPDPRPAAYDLQEISRPPRQISETAQGPRAGVCAIYAVFSRSFGIRRKRGLRGPWARNTRTHGRAVDCSLSSGNREIHRRIPRNFRKSPSRHVCDI